MSAPTLAFRYLRGDNLEGWDLRGKSLIGADLTDARLAGARLDGASLRMARLVRADLSGVSAVDASFELADLSFARLNGADLRGVKVDGAVLQYAQLVGVKLDAGALGELDTFGTALLRSDASGQVDTMFDLVRSPCCALAVSPNGVFLASGHWDGSIRLWDMLRGVLIRMLLFPASRVEGLAFAPDGRTLACASRQAQTLALWDISTAAAHWIHEKEHAWSLCFSPDGTTLAHACPEGIALRDPATGAVQRVFASASEPVACVAFHPDGSILASVANRATVTLWDPATGAERCTLQSPVVRHERSIGLAFSPDGATLATGDPAWWAWWNLARGKLRPAPRDPPYDESGIVFGHCGDLCGLAFMPDGAKVISASRHRLIVRDAAGGRVRHYIRVDDAPSPSAHELIQAHGIECIALTRDGATLASGSEDGTIALRDASTCAIRSILPARVPLDTAACACLAVLLACPQGWASVAPDGRYKLGGKVDGAFWHAIGACRFEPGELDHYLPALRVPEDEPLFALPRRLEAVRTLEAARSSP